MLPKFPSDLAKEVFHLLLLKKQSTASAKWGVQLHAKSSLIPLAFSEISMMWFIAEPFQSTFLWFCDYLVHICKMWADLFLSKLLSFMNKLRRVEKKSSDYRTTSSHLITETLLNRGALHCPFYWTEIVKKQLVYARRMRISFSVSAYWTFLFQLRGKTVVANALWKGAAIRQQ